MTFTFTGSAEFSEDMRKRYLLTRDFNPLTAEGREVCWVMLNPSTATAEVNDPTITRCCGFSMAWGFDRLTIVNLFAYRATDPLEMRAWYRENPVDERETEAIVQAACRSSVVVAAWGAHGNFLGRGVQIVKALTALGVEIMCLGETAAGEPRHPLYLASDTSLRSFA